MTDPIHEQAGYEVGDSGDSHAGAMPEIVRDVQAAGHCAECGSSLAQFTTIHIHRGKPYCPKCYHAEAGS